MKENLPESETEFIKWLDLICQRPLGSTGIERMETLAREMAIGVAEQYWSTHVMRFQVPLIDTESDMFREWILPSSLFKATTWSSKQLLNGNYKIAVDFEREYISALSGATVSLNEDAKVAMRFGLYLFHRWNLACPSVGMLQMNGYFVQTDESNPYVISRIAFELAKTFSTAKMFFSYRRAESSAFALLVLARLKLVGLEGFLDLAIQPGENWHAGIRERIQQHDSFVLLLGPTTLKSDIVKQEIQWAIEFGLDILPIWHSGFAYNADDWPELPPDVTRVLGSNHSIRVLDESALGYNNAIVELLNRFGVTP